MDFKNIPKKYRPIPFWSWNEKLDTEETKEQVRIMDEVGIGGFFMHARGGLETEYMSDEWFDNIDAAISEGKKLGMRPWAYDENGWPSGFGNGAVNGLGVKYQQKYLRMSDSEPKENIIGKFGEHWFYYEINPFYVDVLDKKVVAEFIRTTYEPYYEKYGTDIEGFFTDEPQVSRNGIPWSFTFEDEYKSRYGEDITDILESLFLPIGDYKGARVLFWKMVTDMFSENFYKQIYDWCDKRGLKLTGHLVCEDEFPLQLISNGACMPHYEYFHIPGMDKLGRNISEIYTPLQLGSACAQLGKDYVLSETYALSGHNVSFAELKGIFEWQMSHGVNLLCQHLEGYSIRGMRKRDYPPAMYYQQPWWSEYDKFVEAMSREGMVLAEGKETANVLLLHPMTTAWTLYDDTDDTPIRELDKKFIDDIVALKEKHIEFHLGDETLIERHGRVEKGKFIIGNQAYDTVINSLCDVLLPNTELLLDEFVAQGGVLFDDVTYIEPDNITDNPSITYTKRIFDTFNVHFFVNTSPDRKNAKINVCGKVLDIYSGDLLDFSGSHEFEPWGSLMVIEDGTENTENELKKPVCVRPKNEFKITGPVKNSITLDRCDYYFDGELQEKNGYVLNICERANALERPIKIHQDYYVAINCVPDKLELVTETPEKFGITVNGTVIDKTITGYFRDKSFKTIDISGYIKQGENVISFDCDFAQSDKTYQNLRNARIFESEKNKLSYETEIEAIYLLGDFAAGTSGNWEKLDKNAVRYDGDFTIEAPKTIISGTNIEQQGYPFFSGELELEGEIDIPNSDAVLELDIKGINAVRVKISDTERVMLTDNRLPLAQFGVTGLNTIKLTLINNLRNLLGPHHLKCGETYTAAPTSFFKEPCVWNFEPEKDWDDNYCFVETGIL
ncbi:MAG: hypothetical protein IJC09_06780 [Clostridia bacterium]|nr:hypothetical protein [Clostridia bacterium]